MALDSRQKRAAIIGVARPWYRNSHPSSLDASQRPSVANTYPVAAFAVAVVKTVEGLEYTLYPDRLHYTLYDDRQHYTVDET